MEHEDRIHSPMGTMYGVLYTLLEIFRTTTLQRVGMFHLFEVCTLLLHLRYRPMYTLCYIPPHRETRTATYA